MAADFLALDPVAHREGVEIYEALRSARIVRSRDREIRYGVVIEIDVEQICSAVSDYHVGRRIYNFRVARWGQAQQADSGCSCRERIHVELLMN